jgi:2-dehydro-3-deoxygluconokinase
MNRVVCFGEPLLRLSPSVDGGWIREGRMSSYVGGAELNVATALAIWGMPVGYAAALPLNGLGDDMMEHLRVLGIDASAILRTGGRVGIYFLPQGADLKKTGVIYDRAYSSFSSLKPGDIDWNSVLSDCGWFHFSAITPALSERCADVCREAVEAAHSMGIGISVDLNFRSKLWQYGVKPTDVMPSLVRHASLVMGNVWSAAELLGIPVEADIHAKGSDAAYVAHARETSLRIFDLAPGCRQVANTFRFDRAGGLSYFATLDTLDAQSVSKTHRVADPVDRVGSGDCFMAGFLYGNRMGWTPSETVDFAASAAVGKLMELGDATAQTVEQIRKRYGYT